MKYRLGIVLLLCSCDRILGLRELADAQLTGDSGAIEAGCADSKREGFIDPMTFPRIAACAGAWSQPGLRPDPVPAAVETTARHHSAWAAVPPICAQPAGMSAGARPMSNIRALGGWRCPPPAEVRDVTKTDPTRGGGVLCCRDDV